jgi:aminoglycoside phosphotransferase (APT) family kinase protein
MPAAARSEDAFDVARVHAWLREASDDELPETLPEVGQFRGGASNLTYVLRYPACDYVLRRPPVGKKAKSAHDMAREFDIQSKLRSAFTRVPDMVALCRDDAVLGATFYVMRRCEGVTPRARMPKGTNISPTQARTLCENFVETFVALHDVDIEATGLDALSKGTGYVERQVGGWTRRYRDAKTWNVPSWNPVIGWLEENTPSDVAHVLVHNDYRLDNLVLNPADPTDIVAVLDWELATIGDPLMDVGNTLAYWVNASDDRLYVANRRQPTHLPGMMTRDELVRAYLDRSGHTAESLRFYQVQGLFRLAGIVQQIYYRYHHKQTTNPAFRRIWVLNHYLRWRAGRVLRGALS